MRTLLIVLTALSTLVAVAALSLSAVLYFQVREERSNARQVEELAIETANTVVVQHKTLGLLVSTQRNLFDITKQLAAPRPAAPPRTLYSAPVATP